MNPRVLLVTYVLVNACLYSVLMPLWEGFDEPFHFAYIQRLGNGQGLPDPRSSPLSGEVVDSLLLAPASRVVQMNLPQVTSYAEYFSWPAARRAEARQRLRTIPKDRRWQPSQSINYEGHHPPLSYLLLIVPERLMAQVSLPVRVMLLRILAAVAGSLLLLVGAEQLFLQMGIPDTYRLAALFCLFSCQMTWATLAHIGNDWLALPIAIWTLVALNRYYASPTVLNVALASVLLALGLLTKAYFLAFVPLMVRLCILQKRWREFAVASIILAGLAGPWYARNWVRYGSLTGTQESRAGIGLGAVLHATPTLNWPAVIGWTVHSALWTGNNSFVAFSMATLNLAIGTCLAALLLWAASRHTSAEWITFSYSALFALALGYSAAVSHIFTQGVAMGPSPWYAQVISAPLLGLALLGASRWRRLGKFIVMLLVLLFGYVLAATYAVKLIPLYGGYDGRGSLGALAAVYGNGRGTLTANLDTAALAPAIVIYLLAGIAIALVATQQVVLTLGIFSDRSSLP